MSHSGSDMSPSLPHRVMNLEFHHHGCGLCRIEDRRGQWFHQGNEIAKADVGRLGGGHSFLIVRGSRSPAWSETVFCDLTSTGQRSVREQPGLLLGFCVRGPSWLSLCTRGMDSAESWIWDGSNYITCSILALRMLSTKRYTVVCPMSRGQSLHGG